MASTSTVRLPSSAPPQLTVLIDVEEEFDWDSPFDRTHISAEAVRGMDRAMELFAEFHVVPVGVVSYPVAVDPGAQAILRPYVESGRLEVGSHLHPWVCPPHDEPVNRRNSYPGNLSRELEAAKLVALTEAIATGLGKRPLVYQAGRYGFGPHTAATLQELGYLVDMSASPAFDYREDAGPDYSTYDNDPLWSPGEPSLLRLPVTGAFTGFLGGLAPGAFWLANRAPFSWCRMPGVLAHLGAAERLRLSPEGHQLGDMQRLVRSLQRRGVQTYCCSFHSPSLVPGHTSYVRNAAELDKFHETLRGLLSWFLGDFGGQATTPLELHAQLARHAAPAALA